MVPSKQKQKKATHEQKQKHTTTSKQEQWLLQETQHKRTR